MKLQFGSISKFAQAAAFMCLVWYSEIIQFQVPIFSLLLFPIGMVWAASTLLINRLSDSNRLRKYSFLGSIILMTTAILSITLGGLHDKWLMEQASAWGAELRTEYRTKGVYPKTERRFFHGYIFQFTSPLDSFDGKPAIIFNKFGSKRQTYLVAEDLFKDEREV